MYLLDVPAWCAGRIDGHNGIGLLAVHLDFLMVRAPTIVVMVVHVSW